MSGKSQSIPGDTSMVGSPRHLALFVLPLAIFTLTNSALSQDSATLLRLQRSKAVLNLDTNVVHAQGMNGITYGKSGSVSSYPNSLACLLVYGDGKYVMEKRDESTVGKPKVKTAEGTLSGDDLQHLKSLLDDDGLKKITSPKPPELPDDAVSVREIESIDAQIDRSGSSQHFTTIKERLKTNATSGMDKFIDNGAPYQKTLNPLLKWFDGLEKKSKSEFKDAKPQYCSPLSIG
jgi:hypothetical protein